MAAGAEHHYGKLPPFIFSEGSRIREGIAS
jgi:hypothetical protein